MMKSIWLLAWSKSRLAWGVIGGVFLGVVVSLIMNRIPSDVATARMQTEVAPTVKDYVVLISGLYALDHDADRARARLVQLGITDPAAQVAAIAQKFVAEKQERKLIVDVVTLAQALGAQVPELVAYIATPMPAGVAAQPTPLPTVDWDIRLSAKLEPPVKLVPAEVKSGQIYWRLVRAYWLSPEEGHDAFHIFVNVLNKEGIPIPQPIIIENGGKITVPAQPKPDSDYLVNFPMAGTLGSYTCYVAGDLPSDRVVGLGLGLSKGGKDHTCFQLTFQETVAP